MPIICHSDLDGWVSAMVIVSAKNPAPDSIWWTSYGDNRDEQFKKWLMPQLTALPSNTVMRTSNEDVYFVDVSLNVGELEWARDVKKRSRWIFVDHHHGSADFDTKGIFDEVIHDFSGEKCASDLVYEYLYKNTPNTVLKGWVDAAHDRDMWINEDYQQGFELELMLRHMLSTRTFVNYLFTYNQMPVKSALALNRKFIIEGLRSFERNKKLADNTTEVFTKDEQKFVFAYITGNASDIGYYLYNQHGRESVVVMIHNIDDRMVVNFRTCGNIDVSKMAQKFDGGGHPQAAGGKLTNEHLKGGYIAIYRDILKVIIEEERNGATEVGASDTKDKKRTSAKSKVSKV
jgi:oligoribonuclease NrnB/cAMP/cGMP phosphodiesterase (DHH superfamily)